MQGVYITGYIGGSKGNGKWKLLLWAQDLRLGFNAQGLRFMASGLGFRV